LEQQRFYADREDADRQHAIELGHLAIDSRKLDVEEKLGTKKIAAGNARH